MWDTGSPISIISKQYLNDLQKKQLSPIYNHFYDLNNNKLEIQGSITIEIQINECKLKINLKVINDLAFDCILGMDIIS